MVATLQTTKIAHNNGTDAMAIDTTGNVTVENDITITGGFFPKGLTYWPSCNYHKTSLQTASSAGEKITFNTKIHDNGNNFNASTGVFTCPIAGVYIATYIGLTESDTTGTNYILYHNSNQVSRERTGTSSGHQTATVSGHINAAANDTIYFAIGTSGHKSYGDSNKWTTVHITYIGG